MAALLSNAKMSGAFMLPTKPVPFRKHQRFPKLLRRSVICGKNQKARKFRVTDFENFDTIYAMDESNYQNILKLAKKNAHIAKVKLILNEVNPLSNHSVPDPYYGGTQGFEKVYMMLEEACSIIAEKLQNER
mgnify:CR=1 FL=1